MHLGVVAGGKQFIGVPDVGEGDGPLDHFRARIAQQLDDPLAGDAVEEGAVDGRCVDHPILGQEQVGVGEFGDMAVGVEHDGGVETLLPGLGHATPDIGIEARGLGLGRGLVRGRAAETGPQGAEAVAGRQW